MSETLPRMVLERAAKWRDRTAMRRKEGGAYRDISWETVARNIRAYGSGLLALGLQPGDRAAIMSANSPEWAFADLGIMAAGGLSVPVYHTEGAKAVLHILKDSGSRFLFIRSVVAAEDLLERLHEAPELEKIILLEDALSHPRVLTLKEFLALGEKAGQEELDRRLAGGDGKELATIVYTSGTTGIPKGGMLTHENFLANVEAALKLFDIGPEDEALSFLPLSHVFERVDGYYLMLHQGTVISYAESIDTVPANLQEIRPTVMISVPRLFEKMFARVMERVLDGPWLKKQIFFGALKAGKAYIRQQLAGQKPGPLLSGAAALARKTVFAKLKGHLGGRIRFFFSGGAPLAPEVAEFFLAADIPIYQGYGLTETSAGIAVNTPEAHKLGTVGKPFPGTEVRIAEDGEILIKGPGVFQGYWNMEEETRKAFTEGWFKTGDIGEIDEGGFLRITDRKKDLIVTAGGENIAPQLLENLFKTDKFIANAMVYGDRKPYLTALIVPNFDNLEKYAARKQIDYLNHCDLVSHARILDLIRRRIDRLQADLPPIQQVKRFTLLSRDFEKEEITPTLKVRRNVVRERFHQILDGMYLAKGREILDNGFCAEEESREAGQGAR